MEENRDGAVSLPHLDSLCLELEIVSESAKPYLGKSRKQSKIDISLHSGTSSFLSQVEVLECVLPHSLSTS